MAGRLWWLQVSQSHFLMLSFLRLHLLVKSYFFGDRWGTLASVLSGQFITQKVSQPDQGNQLQPQLGWLDSLSSRCHTAMSTGVAQQPLWPTSSRAPSEKIVLESAVTSECLNTNHVKMTGCFVQCLLPYDIDDIDICCFFLKIRWCSQISNLKYSKAKQKESSITVYNITWTDSKIPYELVDNGKIQLVCLGMSACLSCLNYWRRW